MEGAWGSGHQSRSNSSGLWQEFARVLFKTMTIAWIAKELNMGAAGSLANLSRKTK
ncbi:MAG: hypothetical protein ACREE6_06435 [Limisphaerales bacterium]